MNKKLTELLLLIKRIEVYKEVGVTYLNIDIPADTENPLEVIEKVKAWAE